MTFRSRRSGLSCLSFPFCPFSLLLPWGLCTYIIMFIYACCVLSCDCSLLFNLLAADTSSNVSWHCFIMFSVIHVSLLHQSQRLYQVGMLDCRRHLSVYVTVSELQGFDYIAPMELCYGFAITVCDSNSHMRNLHQLNNKNQLQ